MTHEISNIWNSVEFDAISRNFSYLEYLDFCICTGSKYQPVRAASYQLLKSVFNAEMVFSYA